MYPGSFIVMKKVLSISLSLLIVLSLLHLTIAFHVCKGEIAQVKVSFSGKKGTCGMENNIAHKSLPISFSNHCCDNGSSVFVIENCYSPDNNQTKNIVQNLIITPFIFLTGSFSYSRFLFSSITNARPPGSELKQSVSLPFICIFRI